MRILYVEDNESNIALIERVAKTENHQVVTYYNAEDALDNFYADQPDMAIVDVRLPGQIDGVQLILSLRDVQPNLPIVVVTAYDYKELEDACRQAGCDAYYVKPLNVQQVQQIITEFNAAG